MAVNCKSISMSRNENKYFYQKFITTKVEFVFLGTLWGEWASFYVYVITQEIIPLASNDDRF